jgi:adenine deaminase
MVRGRGFQHQFTSNYKMLNHLSAANRTSIIVNTVKLGRPLESRDFAVKTTNAASKRVKVSTLLCDENVRGFQNGEAYLRVERGIVLPEAEKDVLLIAVAELHKATGNIGVGFVTGVELRKGTIGTTVAHDHHNIVLIGSSPNDMAIAENHIVNMHGGQVAVIDREIKDSIPLPLVGLMADVEVGIMSDSIKSMKHTLSNMGCSLKHPFMHLSFLTGALWRWGWSLQRHR